MSQQMKKVILLLIAPAIFFAAGCGNSKKNDSNSSMPGMKEVQIKVNGTPLLLMVPSDSTKGKVEIVEQNWGATEIKLGKDFQISISEGDGNITLIKSDIAGNDVNKFKRYIKDEPTLLFWESQITEPEFHFYSVQKAGKTSYVVEDIKGEMFSEKGIQTMIDAGKSLKVAETAKPNS